MPLSRLFAPATARLSASTVHNLTGAGGIQLALLVSGSLSARLLGPEGRGYLAILTIVPSAIGQLGAVGMSLAATYYLSVGAIGGTELLRVLRRPALTQLLVVTLVHTTVIFGYILLTGAPIVLAAVISLATTPTALCIDYGLAFLLGARRHGTVNLIRTLNPIFTAAGIAVLYLYDDQSLAAVIAASMAASAVVGVIALWRGVASVATIQVPDSLVKRLGWRRAKTTVLAFGRQGYVGYLSPVETFKLDQLTVGLLLSPRELGFYVVGAAFTNLGRVAAANLGLSATPDIAAHADFGSQRRAVRRTLMHTGSILSLLTIVLAACVPIAIPVFFGSNYGASIPIAELLLLASLLLSMKRVVVDVMRGVGDARVGTRAELLNLFLFVSAAVPLGLWLGGRGVAFALVLAAAGSSALLVRILLRTSTFDRKLER